MTQNVQTTIFKYDPFGKRIQKSGSLGTTNYLYDGLNLIETSNSSGAEVSSYTQTQKIDETLAELRSGTTDYYQADGLGSTTSVGGSSGTLANTYSYDSFGNLIASSGTLPNYFQYTGREFDPETGIYEYRARYFDPTVGRFLSEDPAADGVNQYAYAANNPATFADPLGLYIVAPGIPAPSPALDKFLKCMDTCVGQPITVSSTFPTPRYPHHQDPGHAAGTSVDILPPLGPPSSAVFCCAGRCGAAWGINEGAGGVKTLYTSGYNYHLQLFPPHHPNPNAPNSIAPYCKPGRCPFSSLVPTQ